MQVKTCAATVKAAGAHEGVDEGVVEAIVAAYNVDSVGDRIIPWAFKNTLERRKASGRPIPFVWSHKSDDPFSYIGVVEEAEERPEGLWVRARLDLDEPMGAKCFKLLKGRRIDQFSFAYEEVDARPAAKDDSGARQDLHELEIFECGPTMVGANRSTSLVGVKHDQPPVTVTVNNNQASVEPSAAEKATDVDGKTADTDLKAGRVLSRRNAQALAEALATIQRVLSSADSGDEGSDSSNAEKAKPTEPADTEESQVAPEAAPETKSVEPAGGTASVRLPSLLDLQRMALEAETETF